MEKPEGQPPAILIAGADDAGRESLACLLTIEGCRPLHAKDGAEALRVLASGRADAALVDDGLSGPGALEILARLRELGLAVPVVVVSAAPSARRVVQAMQHGASNFLATPVAPADLFDALRDALAARGPFPPAARQDDERQRQGRRLEAFGRLTGGVVHDFNNLLTVINGYAQMLHHRLGSDNPLRSYAAEIVRAVEHGSALTRQLLSAGRAEPQAVVLDLNEAVRRAGQLVRPLLGRPVELTLDLAAEPCPVRADPGQLEQVAINLAVNARDAMPQGGRLCVRTESDPAGAWVWLVVSDTGCGMDQATQARLFEPFFTTKPPGEGTGLGLATVHGIVTQAGGRIDVVSAPGRGTTFTVALPRATEPPARPGPLPLAAPAGESRTVLLVEADDGVRSLMSNTLALEGHRVLQAADGPDALALAGDHPDAIDLLITEVLLPRGTGPELARVLRGRRPGVAVLFVTSNLGDRLADQPLPGEPAETLLKPFSPHSLAQRVAEVLARQPDGPRCAGR